MNNTKQTNCSKMHIKYHCIIISFNEFSIIVIVSLIWSRIIKLTYSVTIKTTLQDMPLTTNTWYINGTQNHLSMLRCYAETVFCIFGAVASTVFVRADGLCDLFQPTKEGSIERTSYKWGWGGESISSKWQPLTEHFSTTNGLGITKQKLLHVWIKITQINLAPIIVSIVRGNFLLWLKLTPNER